MVKRYDCGATDEEIIESLQEDVLNLREEASSAHTLISAKDARIASLASEVERLRGALIEISTHTKTEFKFSVDAMGDTLVTPHQVPTRAAEIARRAMEGRDG